MTKKILIYGTGIFFSKILVFLMLPIYTRIFSPADYGYYDVLVSNMQMIVSIAFVEIWSGIIRFMYEDKERYTSIKSFLSLLPVLVVIYGLVIWVLSYFIELKYPITTVIYGLTYLLFNVCNNICRGLNQNVEYVLSGVISTCISSLLSILGTIVFHKGIVALLYAQIIGFLCSVFYIEWRTNAFRYAFRQKRSFTAQKRIISYCFPLMLNSFSFLFLGTYNKNIIIRELGDTVSGYYAFALKFAAIISILISIYSLAWQEEAFLHAQEDDKNKIYSFYINAFLRCVGLMLAIYISLVYFIVPLIGGTEFSHAIKYIPLAVIGAFLAEVSGVFSVVIAVNKKTLETLFSTIIGACVNVFLMLNLVGKLGVNASNIALICGFGTAAALRYYFSKQMINLKLELRWFLLISMEVVCVFLLYQYGNALWMFIFLLFSVVIWFIVNSKMFIVLLGKLLRIGGK